MPNKIFGLKRLLPTVKHQSHFVSISRKSYCEEKKYRLHIHRNTTFSNNDRRLAQRIVSMLDKILQLKGIVITSTFLTPIKCFKKEHALITIRIRTQPLNYRGIALPWIDLVHWRWNLQKPCRKVISGHTLKLIIKSCELVLTIYKCKIRTNEVRISYLPVDALSSKILDRTEPKDGQGILFYKKRCIFNQPDWVWVLETQEHRVKPSSLAHSTS